MPRLPSPPKCPPVAKTLVEHGVMREDPYYWLRDQANPAVLKYVTEENDYYRAVMANLADLKAEYLEKLKHRLEPEAVDVPYRSGPYFYGSRTPVGAEYPIYFRFRAPIEAGEVPGPEETLLDLNEIAKTYAYVNIDAYAVNDAHDMLAYSLDTTGDEIHRVYFKCLGGATPTPETIEETEGPVVFSRDGNYLYYIRLNEQHRPFQAWRHAIGTATTEDTLLYEEEDERFFLSLKKSSDGRWIFLNADSAESSETRFADRAGKVDHLEVFSSRSSRHEYDVDGQGDRFLILSNHEETNFGLYTCPVPTDRTAVTAPRNWLPIFLGDARTDLRELVVFASHFAVVYGDAGKPSVRIFATAGAAAPFDLDLYESVRDVSFSDNEDYHASAVRIRSSNPRVPTRTLEYALDSGNAKLLHERAVPGFQTDDYVVERIEIAGKDGVPIPVSLMYRAVDRGRPLPTLLYGYGAYGMVTPVGFSVLRSVIVDAGFLYAIAHVRGSGDLGQRWYREGKYLKKRQSFLDFEAVAKGLVERGRTLPGEVTLHGGSAGGLLVGATLNLDPSLYRGAIAEVPFLDVLTTMLDDDLPLTPTEWDEWGDPRLPEFYHAIHAYSPYDRLAEGIYPYILVNGGWNDPRVPYWEPAKYVAKLRELRRDDRLTLLDIEMGAGHFGVSGRFAALEKPAELLAFLHAIHFERSRFA